MRRLVFGTSNNVRIRALNSTDSAIIGTASTTEGLEWIRTTAVINGHRWHVVRFNGREGFIREDVARVVDIKPPQPQGRKLTYLVIHCTATPEGREVTKEEVTRWHTAPKPQGRGWSVVGYSRLINLRGDLILMHNYNENDIVEPWEVTNGASGINSISRHICYVGGVDKSMKAKDTRTSAQLVTMQTYVLGMVKKYPNILVCGHYHFANKACPSFNVENWCRSIGVPEKNIFNK
jgi:N-acetylmuramoyl-L-alanine amidase